MSETEIYKYDTDELLMLKFDTAQISKSINLSFVMATKLFERIQSTEEFGEKSRKELAAFFDLIHQYHGVLCDENGKNDPGKIAEEELVKFKKNWDEFYAQCIYNKLESVD